MTDLASRIQAVIARCRVPDRAGAAVAEMLSERYVLVDRAEWDELVKIALWGDANMHDALLLIANNQPSDLARDAPGGDTPLGNGG